jgi:hypothetical protein
LANFKFGKRWVITAIFGLIISVYGLQFSTNILKSNNSDGYVYYDITTPMYYLGLFLSLIGFSVFTFSLIRYFGKVKEFSNLSMKILTVSGIFFAISAFFLMIVIYLWSRPPTQRSWFFILPTIIFASVIGIFHFIVARKAQDCEKNKKFQFQNVSRAKLWIISSSILFLILGISNSMFSLRLESSTWLFFFFFFMLPLFIISILLWNLLWIKKENEKINYFFNVVELCFFATVFYSFFYPLSIQPSLSFYVEYGTIGTALIILIIICLSMIFVKLFYYPNPSIDFNPVQSDIKPISQQKNKIDLIKYVDHIIPKNKNNSFNENKEISSEDNYTNVTKKIKLLTLVNSQIFLDDIRNLILDGKSDEAYRQILEREKAYEKFVILQKDLKNVESKIKTLAQRFAEGESTSSAFEKARDDLEREKKDIEEQLWALRTKLFKEEYEKPF